MKPEEIDEIYNADYPNTIQSIIDNPMHSVQMVLQIGFVKGTSIVQYGAQYDRYVKIFKYGPLNNNNSDKLWKANLIGFHKYDHIARSEVRVDMFKPDKTDMQRLMQRMARLNTPLEVDFAIQLPLQYMQILLNCFDRTTLPVSYESSMSDIIDCGMTHEDFRTVEIPEDISDEEKDKLTTKNQSISAYKVRISEANQLVLNAIPLIVKSEGDIDVSGAFAMLPCGYNTRAVITLNTEYIKKYRTSFDSTITDMMEELIDTLESLDTDIKGKA